MCFGYKAHQALASGSVAAARSVSDDTGRPELKPPTRRLKQLFAVDYHLSPGQDRSCIAQAQTEHSRNQSAQRIASAEKHHPGTSSPWISPICILKHCPALDE
jgi:hypothetical protein